MTANLDIEGLERLEKAATEAPWHYTRTTLFQCGDITNGIGSLYGTDCLIYTTPHSYGVGRETWERQACDGEFVAALRNAAPALLSLARSAEAMRETMHSLVAIFGAVRDVSPYQPDAGERFALVLREAAAAIQPHVSGEPAEDWKRRAEEAEKRLMAQQIGEREGECPAAALRPPVAGEGKPAPASAPNKLPPERGEDSNG